MTSDLNELIVSLNDLSDEGLDALLRISLKTSKRQIDDWTAIGELIEKFEVSLSPQGADPVEWNATIETPEFITEYGETPRAAVARAVIHHLFPEAPSLRFKRRLLNELLSEDFKESWLGHAQKRTVEWAADKQAPANTAEGEALVILTVRDWDAV
jgi:hypothetical protein